MLGGGVLGERLGGRGRGEGWGGGGLEGVVQGGRGLERVGAKVAGGVRGGVCDVGGGVRGEVEIRVRRWGEMRGDMGAYV